MRLYDEIFKNADGVAAERLVLVPNGGGYFEGVKTVEEFSSERLVLRFARLRAEVVGSGVFIAKFCEGDLELRGRISAFRVLDGAER